MAFRKTIELCLIKDNKAQDELYNMMYSTVFNTCMRYAPNEATGKDYIQECFIKIFDKIDLFIGDTVAELGAWVKGLCIHYCVDQTRALKIKYSENTDLSKFESDDSEYDLESQYTLSEIFNAIHLLSPKYKTIFNMFVLDGYSHNEITKELGLNPGTSKATLFKAKKKVKEILLKTT